MPLVLNHLAAAERSLEQHHVGAAMLLIYATLEVDFLSERFFGRIRGLMADRNKCEFEHGLCPKRLTEKDVVRHMDTVKQIIEITMVAYGRSLEYELEKYRFPKIQI